MTFAVLFKEKELSMVILSRAIVGHVYKIAL